VSAYLRNELRFRAIEKADPGRFEKIQAVAQAEAQRQWERCKRLAAAQTKENAG